MNEKKKYQTPKLEIEMIDDVILTSVTVTEWDGNNVDKIKF